MPASESVPRSRRKRRTPNTNHAHGWVNDRPSDKMCNGTDPEPPAASVTVPKSRRRTSRTLKALGPNATQVLPSKGTGNYRRRTSNSGSKVSTPALEKGYSVKGERVLNGRSSASPAVVQSDKQTVGENGCPSPARPKRWGSRNWLGCKRRTKWTEPVCAGYVLTPPVEEEEDWEKEFVYDQPYAPDDLISLALRGLSLHPKAPPTLPVVTDYNPSRSHPSPVERSCCRPRLEEGQFSDVDE